MVRPTLATSFRIFSISVIERMKHSGRGGSFNNSYLRIGRHGDQRSQLLAYCCEIVASQSYFNRKIA
jgi:hypothetical protein